MNYRQKIRLVLFLAFPFSCIKACTFIFVLKMNKCHRVERASSEKRTYNMQCTIFTDTSLNFILLQTRFRPKRANRAQNVSGKNIYAVGIERLVCIERYIGTFLYFFLFCFCFTILFLSSRRTSGVGFCVVPNGVGSASTEHSTAQHSTEKIFLLCGCECIVKKYI